VQRRSPCPRHQPYSLMRYYDKIYTLGYIVPIDVPDLNQNEMDFMEKALSMRQIETVARRICAKHVLISFS
jgi:hypothetical protein